MSDRKDFATIGREVGELLEVKNKAYGSAYAKADQFLSLLYPNGVPPEGYGDMLVLVRIFDKMMRIATDKGALNEDPWKDIAGYAILMLEKQSNPELTDMQRAAKRLVSTISLPFPPDTQVTA